MQETKQNKTQDQAVSFEKKIHTRETYKRLLLLFKRSFHINWKSINWRQLKLLKAIKNEITFSFFYKHQSILCGN